MLRQSFGKTRKLSTASTDILINLLPPLLSGTGLSIPVLIGCWRINSNNMNAMNKRLDKRDEIIHQEMAKYMDFKFSIIKMAVDKGEIKVSKKTILE
jgi:hypothetical protein